MLIVERQARIAELVRQAGAVTTEELAERLDVSIETIRRDLMALDRRGALTRVHGGAAALSAPSAEAEASFDERSASGLEAKQRIARAAAALVPRGGTIMIDVGTTALLLAKELADASDVTVVTPSLRAAVELADRPGITVLVSGGRVRGGDMALSNATAARFFDDVYVDVAFLGSGGLDAEAGLTDYYLDEVDVRRVALRNARHAYVLADATKFDHVAPHRVAALSSFTGVVVDEAPTGALRAALEDADAAIVMAG